MAPSFPIPILAVTADAVRDLDGREALSGLWTLFTKCKESLQDGRRLENISWRLWYRELMLTDRPPLKNSTHYSLEGELLDEKLSYSHPSSSSFSSAMSSSASSYSPPHSPALSHTSSGYRPPTPAESLNVLDPLAYAVHDPQIEQGETTSSMSLQGLDLTDLSLSSPSSATVRSVLSQDTTTAHVEPYSALPSPLPSPSIPQSIPQSLPPLTAPSIPHASASIEHPASTHDLSNLSPHHPPALAPSIPHPPSPSTHAPAPFDNPASASAPSPPRARPAIARSYTESSVVGVMDASRARRSSFAGMSVGRIICDMLPMGGGGGDGDGGWAAGDNRRDAGADQRNAPPRMTSVGAAAAVAAAAAAAAAAIACLPTPETETEEAESNSRVRMSALLPREEPREASREALLPRETPREGAREESARIHRPPEESAFAAHVAHVAGAAASGVAHALALAPGEAGAAGGGGGAGARQWDSSGALAAEERVVVVPRGAADRGDAVDRRGDNDKDKDRHGAAFAPRVLVGEGGAYPVYGERVGPAGAEDERETYSGTATPTHTYTPPQIFQPLQESPQPPRLVVVNPTPNLTPHPTPPSTPIAFAGLPRAFIPGPGQFLMPPGLQPRAHGHGQPALAGNASVQQYHLQQAQLAQLLPPLTLPPPPQAGVRTHVLDGAGFVSVTTGSGSGSSHLQGHVLPDRAGKSAASAGPGAFRAGGEYLGAPHAARGLRHEEAQMHAHGQHAHYAHAPPFFQLQQLQQSPPQFAGYSQGQAPQHGQYSQVSPDGYAHSHAHAAQGRAVVAGGAGLVAPAQAAFLLAGAADEGDGVHLLSMLPPLSYNISSQTPMPGPGAGATAMSGIGNVNASRDNVNRRSISSNTSTSSQATTASLQSTRSRATDSSSATSASARSKTTTGEGFDTATAVGEDFAEATFGGAFFAMGEVQMNKGSVAPGPGMDLAGGQQDQRSDGADDNDEALEEEEDDPLSPLPTVTSFGGSISPRTADKTSRANKRHSLPPRSTSDSAQMRIALSLSPASRERLLDVDAPSAAGEEQSQQQDPANTRQAPARSVARSRSASSTRSVGKRSSLSASSKASRKTAVGPPPPPQPVAATASTATTVTNINAAPAAAAAPASPIASASTSTKNTGMTKATTGSTAMRRSSSTRSTSRTRSAGGSSLGKSRSRSREHGLGLGLGLGMTAASPQAVAAVVAAAVPSTRTAKPAVRSKAKFSLGRPGNKKSAALVAMRRNSSGMTGKGKAKQREEEEEEEEEEDWEAGDRNAGGDDDGMGDLEVAERERRETEEKERERMYLHEQACRAALAEEEKERRRQAERHQLQLGTIAALTGPATADNISETSSKRPTRFNIGSNSDDGMGGKSAGSGSEVSGGVSGQSVAPDTAVVGGGKGKGKEREMSLQQRLAVQQQEYQHQQRQQQQPQAKRSTGQHMHANGHLSKPELHQLQIMEQMHQQQHHPTAAQQQVQQYQQQFQTTQPQQLQPQLSQQVVAAVENSSTSKKGKQRETAVAPPAESSTKPKKSNSRARAGPTGVGVVDPVLAAQIKDSLNTPLLPTGKKRVELVSTESEFETTDDEGDDDDEGEWSSAEMTVDDEEVRQTQEEQEQNRLLLLQIQQQHDHQMQLLQQQQREQRQQQATRPRAPQAPQRTHSSHYPAPNNARGQQLTRAQMQRQAQAQQALVDKAVIEAQRQREMFVKLPTSSFQDLAKARTNSVGLLTQLMNPDVEQFPPNHPYRRGFSSGELRRSGISALSSMQPMTPVVAPTPTPAVNADQPPAVSAVNAPKPMLSTTSAPAPSDAPAAVVKAASSTSRPVATRRNTADIVPTRTAFSPPLRSGGLVLTKSSVALPTATQLQVGSVATKLAHRTSALLERVNINGSGGSGGYRPKGPPKDQEMEEDSDSDDGAIQISKSIAQEKLKALAERRGIKPTAKALDPNAPGPSKPKAAGTDDNDVPQWVVAQPQAQHQRSQSQGEPVQRRVPTGLQLTRVEDEDAPLPPATAPIKVDYPYTLPLPIPPSTPRTTRRNMLATELTESLRRNVLWHRHVDKPNPAIRRTTSGDGGRNNVLGGVRPLTAAPSMVQLHAKGTKPEGTSQITRHEPLTDKEREEARQRRLTRNKSWANDYHYSGW